VVKYGNINYELKHCDETGICVESLDKFVKEFAGGEKFEHFEQSDHLKPSFQSDVIGQSH
jgi:hypothetical protein